MITKKILALIVILGAVSAPMQLGAQEEIPATQEIPAVHPAGTAAEQTGTAAPGEGETPVVIGPNDSITIVTIEAEELNKVWHISSTGDLDLPMVGRIHASGLTTEGFEKELSDKLKQFIRNPQVTAYISEYRSEPVTITGAVKVPGIFQIQSPKTLLGALTMAGGLLSPGPTVSVTRDMKYGSIPLANAQTDSDGKHSTVIFPLREVVDPRSAAANLEMRPNDVVSVATQQRLVYIIGEVNRPGSVELATVETISMMQVLAVAGGLTKVAAPHDTEILRLNSQGLYERIGSVDAKRLMKGKIEDRLLSAGDIVVVPSSNLKIYSQTAAMSMIGGLTMLLGRF